MLSPAQAVLSVYRQHGSGAGRAARSGFWWFTLYLCALTGVLAGGAWLLFAVLDLLSVSTTVENAFVMSVVLAWFGAELEHLCPVFMLVVRRCQDAGINPVWLLVVLVPMGVLFLLWVAVAPSDGPNRYGDVPGRGQEKLAATGVGLAVPQLVVFLWGRGSVLRPSALLHLPVGRV